MIQVSYQNFFFLYLAIWLAVIIFLWIKEVFRMRSHYWERRTDKLFECGSCHHSFVARDEVSLYRCPKCNAICFVKQN